MCIFREECRCNVETVLRYMIPNNYISKNSNCLCNVCAKHAENLMPSLQQKFKTGADVSDKEHEEENSKNYISSNKKNFDNQCSSQDILKSNVEQLVDGLIDFLANSDCSGVLYEFLYDISFSANNIKSKMFFQTAEY